MDAALVMRTRRLSSRKSQKKKYTTFKFEKKSAAVLVEINVADRIVQEEKMEHDTACCKKQVAAKCCTPSGGKIISARCGSALFLIFCSRLLLPKSVTPQWRRVPSAAYGVRCCRKRWMRGRRQRYAKVESVLRRARLPRRQ